MENEYKKIYKTILKLTHPDNCQKYTDNLPAGVKKYLDMLRNDATEAYEAEDYERLDDVLAELLGESEQSYTSENSSTSKSNSRNEYDDEDEHKDEEIADFFRSYDLEVIDKRDKGGALWIIGTENTIGDIVQLAMKKYGVKGNYSEGGRTTKDRAAWWTK